MHRRIAFIAMITFTWAGAAHARIVIPEAVPVGRVVQSAQRRVDADPTNAQAHYALGRGHYLAWAFKSLMIPGFERGEDTEAAPPVLIVSREAYADRLLRNEAARRVRERLGWDGNTARPPEFADQLSAEILALQAAQWAPPSPPQSELDEHAIAALKSLQQAVKLDPNSGAALLCLANLEEEFADRAAELRLDFDGNTLPDAVQIDPKQYARTWRTKAAEAYAKVYSVSIASDSQTRSRTLSEMMALPAYSAIKAYLRLAGESYTMPGQAEAPATPPSADVDRLILPELKRELRKLTASPPGRGVSP